MEEYSEPSLDEVYNCCLYFAELTGRRCIDKAEAFEVLQYLLFKPQDKEGKDIWGGLAQGLVTEIETRHFMLAHIHTKILRVNGHTDFDKDCTHPHEELNRKLDFALFGRDAIPTNTDLNALGIDEL